MMAEATSRWATFRASRWFRLVWIVPVLLVLAALAVLAARGIRALPAGQDFIEQFPGESELPAGAPVGIPAWLAWQHGLNLFFMVMILRFGWIQRTTVRHEAYWTRNNNGLVKTKGAPTRISLPLFAHLSFDALWVINGLVFYVLLFVTGQWMRLVPTNWDIIPNAISTAIQYASLDWPVEHGWLNYNALQVLLYFVVVFIAAPLALLTGLRLAPGLQAKWAWAEKIFPLPIARVIHFSVMIFFVAFFIVHVSLVFLTGALKNLNVMFAARDDTGWLGFWILAAVIVVIAGIWVALRPMVIRTVAGFFGNLSR